MSKQSRHEDINGLNCCAPARTDVIDWPGFLGPRSGGDKSSPIDSFYDSQTLLVRTAAAIDSAGFDADIMRLVAGQLFLGYVSATELYLRQTVATLVSICPVTRHLNSDQTLAFGAVDFYDRDDLAMALTEQVSFTEVGKIRNQLKTRLGIDVQGKNSLERAIDDFETVCQLRHALVHSHGRMNSRNAAQFLATTTAKDSQTRFDIATLDDAASVSVNLVREVNLEVLRHVVWTWIQSGELNTDRRRTRRKLTRLLNAIGSASDAVQGLVALDETDVTDTVIAVIRATQS